MTLKQYTHIVKCVLKNPKTFGFYKEYLIDVIMLDIDLFCIDCEYLIDIIKINGIYIPKIGYFIILPINGENIIITANAVNADTNNQGSFLPKCSPSLFNLFSVIPANL